MTLFDEANIITGLLYSFQYGHLTDINTDHFSFLIAVHFW